MSPLTHPFFVYKLKENVFVHTHYRWSASSAATFAIVNTNNCTQTLHCHSYKTWFHLLFLVIAALFLSFLQLFSRHICYQIHFTLTNLFSHWLFIHDFLCCFFWIFSTRLLRTLLGIFTTFSPPPVGWSFWSTWSAASRYQRVSADFGVLLFDFVLFMFVCHFGLLFPSFTRHTYNSQPPKEHCSDRL